MIKPLANRKNVKNPNYGNQPVRFKDSTSTVAGELFGGSTNKSGQKPTNGGCSGCNR